MSARLQLYLIMSVLVVLGLGLTAYKHLSLGFPMLPGAKEEIWIVQARIRFDATGEPAKVTLNLPDHTNDLVIVESGATAPGFGFSLEQGKNEGRGVWSARAPAGRQSLYYQARIYRGPGEPRYTEDEEDAPPPPDKPLFIERDAAAADAVLADAHARSADAQTLAVRLIRQFNSSDPDENVSVLLGETQSQSERNQLLLDLLHSAEIPARPLRGIDLSEIGRRSSLLELIEVHDGETWHVVDPRTGDTGMPWTFLPWQRGAQSLFEVEGGRDSEIGFSVRADELAARNVALNLGRAQGAGVIDFSIYTLPVDIQNTFATLLLIPIGALVVVILRNLVGLKTSGTFMPILIAVTFVQTTLVTGLILFLTVVGVGLVIRSYLTHLNLLLVPRIAAVLIVVITTYVALSVVGFKAGITAAFSVTFFPMIIISWTIERMSILWEEDGPREVMIQGGGSLLTAIVAYLVMTERHVGFLVFTYPELLLVVLAIILAIGQYSGYRLSELRRFEPLSRDV